MNMTSRCSLPLAATSVVSAVYVGFLVSSSLLLLLFLIRPIFLPLHIEAFALIKLHP